MEFLTSSAGAGPRLVSERELVKALLRRDRKATADFVTLCADAVYAYVTRRLAPKRDLVEDVVQQVFLEALQSIEQFRGEAGLLNWVLSIARHKVQDHYRRRLRAAELVGDDNAAEPASLAPPIDEEMVRRERNDRVEAALARLPEPYRVVLLWRYWERHSTAQMAAATGKTEKAVERLLSRAREAFRRCYGE